MSSSCRRPTLDLIQFRDSGRHSQLIGWAPLTILQYMFTGGYQKPFMCALVFPDCWQALMERQDNVSEHGFLHPVSLALLFAEVAWGHLVSAEEYQVSTWQRPTSHGLLTGNS